MADYRSILDKATAEAKDFVNNPSRMDALLIQLEEKLRQVPAIGETVSGLPVMIAMVKSWIRKEYEVSPKVLAIMAGAFLYLIKKKDLIPDSIPVIGIADDVAVLGLALKLVEKDVQAYREWRDANK
ncbi:MAG: DUF1232 domain-containing protein [Clostridia bacterium]|nr:DUF1232 domain-containing protein [Clostridia bacterium]